MTSAYLAAIAWCLSFMVGDLVAAGLPGDRQDGEPLDLPDPEQLAVGGLDRQAPGMMLRIVESSHFTAYNACEFCLGDGAR